MSGNIMYSVILPVCHGGSFLKNALRSLNQVEYPPESFEVLIGLHSGDRGSRNIVEDESSLKRVTVRCIETGEMNRSAMLNAAINQSNGRVLVFADDDCIFPPDWLRKLEAALEREPEAGVIGGEDVQGKNESSFNLALDYIFNSFIGTGGLRRADGQRMGKYYPKLWNMAVPREIAGHVARISSDGATHIFNESLTVHEDVELVDRIERSGKLIVYAPEVRVLHSRDTTLLLFIKRSFNMARTCRSIGVHRFPHIVLSVFTLSIIVLFAASVVFHPFRILLLITMVLYFSVLLYAALGGLGRMKRFSVFAYIPVLLISLHFARGLGYLFPLDAAVRKALM